MNENFWVAVLGAVTGVLGLGLSLWNASWSQRERVRVRLLRRTASREHQEAGMTELYVQVTNLSPFDVLVEAVTLITRDVDGTACSYNLGSNEKPPPHLIPSRQSIRVALSTRAAMLASMEKISHAAAETGAGKVFRSPRWSSTAGKTLHEVLAEPIKGNKKGNNR